MTTFTIVEYEKAYERLKRSKSFLKEVEQSEFERRVRLFRQVYHGAKEWVVELYSGGKLRFGVRHGHGEKSRISRGMLDDFALQLSEQTGLPRDELKAYFKATGPLGKDYIKALERYWKTKLGQKEQWTGASLFLLYKWDLVSLKVYLQRLFLRGKE